MINLIIGLTIAFLFHSDTSSNSFTSNQLNNLADNQSLNSNKTENQPDSKTVLARSNNHLKLVGAIIIVVCVAIIVYCMSPDLSRGTAFSSVPPSSAEAEPIEEDQKITITQFQVVYKNVVYVVVMTDQFMSSDEEKSLESLRQELCRSFQIVISIALGKRFSFPPSYRGYDSIWRSYMPSWVQDLFTDRPHIQMSDLPFIVLKRGNSSEDLFKRKRRVLNDAEINPFFTYQKVRTLLRNRRFYPREEWVDHFTFSLNLDWLLRELSSEDRDSLQKILDESIRDDSTSATYSLRSRGFYLVPCERPGNARLMQDLKRRFE